jgi:uncharacterized membrane protein YoaK (UPF0700 family)
MNAFLADIRSTIVPDQHGRHGPLPPLLISMTLVTGLVDAFSYLVLGHVFVANMTGNIVLLGFALAGAPGFSIAASATALASFFAGALIGGRIGSRHGGHRGRLHSSAAAVQALFLAASVVLAALSGIPVAAGFRYALIVGLGAAMGLQNAVARKIAVPDLPTTVLTLTITGVAADSALAGGPGSKAGRRLIAVATMLAGALVGAVLVRHAAIFWPLAIALVTIALGAVTSRSLGKPHPDWVRAPGLEQPPSASEGPQMCPRVPPSGPHHAGQGRHAGRGKLR